MNRKQTSALRRVSLVTGCLLVAAAVVSFFCWQMGIRRAAVQAVDAADTIRAVMPEPQPAAPKQDGDGIMPVLTLEQGDFIGLLEFPAYGSVLPVCADWGQPDKYPCRHSGSAYDGTLRIGTTSQKGQYDFYRQISVGDRLWFTDMTGSRYAYTVQDIHLARHADADAFCYRQADLTLFVKNMRAFEYIMVYCDAAG